MSRKSGAGRGTQLPELELECMKILWDNGPLTVRGIRERLLPRRVMRHSPPLRSCERNPAGLGVQAQA